MFGCPITSNSGTYLINLTRSYCAFNIFPALSLYLFCYNIFFYLKPIVALCHHGIPSPCNWGSTSATCWSWSRINSSHPIKFCKILELTQFTCFVHQHCDSFRCHSILVMITTLHLNI